MDATFYLGIFISVLGIVLLIAILRAGKQKAAPPETAPDFTLRTPEDAIQDEAFPLRGRWREAPDEVTGIDLNSLTYEQLMIFAMDNSFGVPEDGELHGQCKAEIRQSMLDWLEGKMTRDQGLGNRNEDINPDP